MTNGTMGKPEEHLENKPISNFSKRLVVVASVGGLVLIALATCLLAYVYSEKVERISVKFVGPGVEVRDPRVPLRPEKESLPDYKLKIKCDTKGFWIFHGKTVTCGPIADTSAVEGIDFQFSDDSPLDKVQQITLIEDDQISDDVICTVQAGSATLSSSGYQFELHTARSLRFGFERIWEGNLGVAFVVVALTLVLMLIDAAIHFKLSLVARAIGRLFQA